MGAYDRTLETLYQAPIASFVAERKRLAAELRAGGDAAGAAELAKRHRPTTSAWTVNQLYWHARKPFDDMLRAAARVRDGDLAATSDYRESLASLRKRAAAILDDAGHKATDPLLRRVSTTLAAIAASGFDPDPPGTLVADRDPPGFEAAMASGEPPRAVPHAERSPKRAADAKEARAAARARAADARERRAAERAQRKRAAAEQARRAAERRRIEARLKDARAAVEKRERALASRRHAVRAAEQELDEARAAVHALERTLGELAKP